MQGASFPSRLPRFWQRVGTTCMQMARPQRGSGGSSRSLSDELVKFRVSVSRAERQPRADTLLGVFCLSWGILCGFLFFLLLLFGFCAFQGNIFLSIYQVPDPRLGRRGTHWGGCGREGGGVGRFRASSVSRQKPGACRATVRWQPAIPSHSQ